MSRIPLNTNVASRTNPALATNPKKSGPLYLQQNRSLLLLYLIGAVVLVIVLIGAVLLYNHRESVANQQLSDAMRTFGTTVVQPGQPVPAGERSFSSSEERARAANAQFADVADHYGMTPAGRNARYLQGVTAMQMGQTATAEELLKKSASSWNGDVASMANLALANLYHGSNRDAQAIELYQKLIAKPTTAVPAGLAQLQLADLYNSEGKKDQARKIYAQIKDKDPKSAAAEIAAQNLGEAPAR